MPDSTMTDLLHSGPLTSRSQAVRFTGQAALALAASFFVAASAHVAVPLPFTPVPFTLQPFAVLLVGMLLTPYAAFVALALYLIEGALGLPVFTPMGLPGVARLLGPTGGYLLAYPFAAALVSALPKLLSQRPRFAAHAGAGAVAMLVVYVSGAFWFSSMMHLPLVATLAGAITPFAASDAVKVCAAAGIASSLQTHRRKA